jgi:hypothetical protein
MGERSIACYPADISDGSSGESKTSGSTSGQTREGSMCFIKAYGSRSGRRTALARPPLVLRKSRAERMA